MTNEEQNVKQKAFWSGKGGDVWVERQDELDITLKPLGDAALKKIDLSNCNKILDIGCGTGRTTLDIASEHVNSKVSEILKKIPSIQSAALNLPGNISTTTLETLELIPRYPLGESFNLQKLENQEILILSQKLILLSDLAQK